MSTSGETFREVVIRLRVESDPRNAKTFQTTAETTQKIHRSSTASIVQGLNQQKIAATTAFGEMLDSAVDYEHSVIRLSGSVAEFRSELGRTALGAIRVGRGFVELGIASEENMEKAVRMLARFQGTVDIVRGTAQTVQGVIRAYDAWRRSIEAVTAAQAALKAVQSLSMPHSGGGSSGFGSLVGDVAGGAIGGRLIRGGAKRGMLARAGGAISRGAGHLARGALTQAPRGGAVIGGLIGVVGTWAAVNQEYREGLFELIGWTNKAAEAQKQFTQFAEGRLKAEQDAVAGFQQSTNDNNVRFGMRHDLAAMKDQLDPLGSPIFRQQTIADSKMTHLNRQLADLDNNFAGPGGAGKRAIIEQQRAEVFGQMQSLMAQDLQYQQQISDERLRTTEETINILKGEREKALDLAKSMQDRQDAAIRRFALMNPRERADIKQDYLTLQQGGPLRPQQLQGLINTNLVGPAEMAGEELLRQGRAMVPDYLLEQGNKQIREQEAKAEKLAIQVTAQTDLQIKISENREGITKMFFEALDQLQDQKMEAFEKALNNKMKQLETNNRTQNASRRFAGGY